MNQCLLVSVALLLCTLCPSGYAYDRHAMDIRVNKTAASAYNFDINQAYTQLMYSYAAYCPKDKIVSWDCFFCKLNQTDTNGFIVSVILENDPTNTFGYVGVRGTTVEVVFRGTQPSSLANWISDFDFAHMKPYADIPNAFVHTGFMDAYDVVKSNCRTAVASLVTKFKATQVVFTGHSLGAAIATLAAIDIGPTLKIPYALYNYGSPRVGNQVFSDFVYSDIPNLFRIVNRADIVPHLPLKDMGFHHVAEEVWWNKPANYIICDKSGEDPTCSDSVEITNIFDHLDYLGIGLVQGGCADH